ncbi:MAG TPA: DNA alkylation repair protein [Verrucomicrobiae bacterium]|nr:DNA alkylation repair protein [Verrucomicrobiae bacterium]
MSLAQARNDLRTYADTRKAAFFPSFFKTGKGEYGEGDRFLGVTVPAIRSVAKKHVALSLKDIDALLKSPWHEDRLLALIILTMQFDCADESARKKMVTFYLAHTDRINNWDLVDTSASRILGTYLLDKDTRPLDRLASSRSLWERRIAMVATLAFTMKGDAKPALRIAVRLLDDDHDLMHKAVGWMLREVGKRCSEADLERFLKKHMRDMPRTTLRYAIERFPEAKRKGYLAKSRER